MSNGTEKEILKNALKAAIEMIDEWEEYVSPQEKMKFREALYQVMKQSENY